jgi:hypothetical protein
MKRIIALPLSLLLLLAALPVGVNAASVPTIKDREQLIEYIREQSGQQNAEFSFKVEGYSEEELIALLSSVNADASSFPTIKSREELIEYMRWKASQMVTEFAVTFEGYTEEAVDVDYASFLPIASGEMNGTLYGDTAELTYTFTYTQASRVLYNLQGGDIELNEKEIALAVSLQKIIKNLIYKDMTDYEKQLAIHDYLVLNVNYDDSRKPGSDAHTAYGAVVNGTAVCQGYAEAARILLSMAGIENYTRTGTAGGENHMWNVVVLDGEAYHMDVTWDGGLNMDDGTRVVSHAYLNLTDAQMKKSHRWDDKLREMIFDKDCTADKYNYFRQNDLVVKSGAEYTKLVSRLYESGVRDIEAYFDGPSVESIDIVAAARAAGSTGYTGFPNTKANVLWIRFK